MKHLLTLVLLVLSVFSTQAQLTVPKKVMKADIVRISDRIELSGNNISGIITAVDLTGASNENIVSTQAIQSYITNTLAFFRDTLTTQGGVSPWIYTGDPQSTTLLQYDGAVYLNGGDFRVIGGSSTFIQLSAGSGSSSLYLGYDMGGEYDFWFEREAFTNDFTWVLDTQEKMRLTLDGSLLLTDYGLGNKEAVDLGETEGDYASVWSTTGMILDKPIKDFPNIYNTSDTLTGTRTLDVKSSTFKIDGDGSAFKVQPLLKRISIGDVDGDYDGGGIKIINNPGSEYNIIIGDAFGASLGNTPGIEIWETSSLVDISGGTLNISNDTISFASFGLGNKEDVDLGKTESLYASVYATDGTVLEKPISEFAAAAIDSALYVTITGMLDTLQVFRDTLTYPVVDSSLYVTITGLLDTLQVFRDSLTILTGGGTLTAANNGLSVNGTTVQFGLPTPGTGTANFTSSRYLYTGTLDFGIGTSGNANSFYIDGATGNVGLGTSSPNYLNDTYGNAFHQSRIQGSGSTSGLQLHNSSTGNTASDGLSLYTNALTTGLMNLENSSLTLGTNDMPVLLLGANGNVTTYLDDGSTTGMLWNAANGRLSIGTPTATATLTLDATGDVTGKAMDVYFKDNLADAGTFYNGTKKMLRFVTENTGEQVLLDSTDLIISNGDFIVNGDGRFVLDRVNNIVNTSGAGVPEGVVTAGIGSTYVRSDGSNRSMMYYKTSGVSNTGWKVQGDFLGWAEYIDTTFKASAPLTLGILDTITLPNHADIINSLELPYGIDSLYNRTDSTIIGLDGDGMNVYMEFIAKPTNAGTRYLEVYLDLSAPGSPVDSTTMKGLSIVGFPKGLNIPSPVVINLGTFNNSDWETNGAKVKIYSENTCEIWGIRYIIKRTSKSHN